MGRGLHFEGTGIIGLLYNGYRLPGRINKIFQERCETLSGSLSSVSSHASLLLLLLFYIY